LYMIFRQMHCSRGQSM